MLRLGGNGGSNYAGYMTFHRVDSSIIKSPSVGVPWRMVIVLLGLVLIGLAGYGTLDRLPPGTVANHAVEMLSDGEGLSLHLATDLRRQL